MGFQVFLKFVNGAVHSYIDWPRTHPTPPPPLLQGPTPLPSANIIMEPYSLFETNATVNMRIPIAGTQNHTDSVI